MLTRLLMMTASLTTASTGLSAAGETVPLHQGWFLQTSSLVADGGQTLSTRSDPPEGWHATTVPTTVLAALVENGVYPDPYYGENLKSIPGYHEGRWLIMPEDSPFDCPWWFWTSFEAPDEWTGKHVALHFDGINYRANIWLNGAEVADSEHVVGMFRRFVFDVTDHIRPGAANCLAVEIVPPGQLPDKDYHTKQIEATTGWDDHNPQPPDMNMGIWEDVFLRVTGPASLAHPYVHTDLDVPSLDTARLTVSVDLTNRTDHPVSTTLRGAIEDVEFAKEIALSPHEKRHVAFSPDDFEQLVVDNPRVWWPNPVGPQELYELHLAASVDGRLSDSTRVRFGIRNITSALNDEGWRCFVVNGRRILIRGGAWMTCDMLLRLDRSRYDALIRYAREANLNMLRSEGFSIRETDEFYDLCDQHGVMVTQQIFGRSIPDEDLAIACTEDTILRIRNHPSLVHFLGHDETFPTASLDAAYRGLIERLAPDRTYQPHSGAFEVEHRFKTGGTRTGTRELWTYANPKHYYERHEDGAWGFAQSGGIGGIVAPFESVRRMIPEDQRWPVWTDALSFHSVIQGGDFFDTVVRMLEARYGESDNLEEFCMKAQALNYESARGMFEAYGRNKYAATGITTWKYDAAWPAFMTWQYVDWYLIAGGAYYGAKKACESLHVQYSYDDDSIYVVNGLYEDFEGLRVSAEVHDFNMHKVYAREETVNVAADGKTEAFTIQWPADLTQSHFLCLALDNAQGRRISNSFYWLSSVPDVRGTVNRSWRDFSVSPKSIADHTQLQQLPPVTLDVAWQFSRGDAETSVRATLTNPTDHLAFLVHLAVRKGEEGEEVTPTYWEDNYISLLPGEQRDIAGVFPTRSLNGAAPALFVDGWNIVSP